MTEVFIEFLVLAFCPDMMCELWNLKYIFLDDVQSIKGCQSNPKQISRFTSVVFVSEQPTHLISSVQHPARPNTYCPTTQPSSLESLLDCLEVGCPSTSVVPKKTVEEYTAIPALPTLRTSYPRLDDVEDGGEEEI